MITLFDVKVFKILSIFSTMIYESNVDKVLWDNDMICTAEEIKIFFKDEMIYICILILSLLLYKRHTCRTCTRKTDNYM